MKVFLVLGKVIVKLGKDYFFLAQIPFSLAEIIRKARIRPAKILAIFMDKVVGVHVGGKVKQIFIGIDVDGFIFSLKQNSVSFIFFIKIHNIRSP